MTAPANKANTLTAAQHGTSAVLTSISSSYRHAEIYGQPHTHTHVINMKNGRPVARSVKGQSA